MQSFVFITFAIGSGAGLVYRLRWYWWRVNAWSEIAAMLAGLINMLVFRLWVYPSEAEFNAHGIEVLLWSLAIVTPAWLLVTLLTRPTKREQLEVFYRKVRPAGPGWPRGAGAAGGPSRRRRRRRHRRRHCDNRRPGPQYRPLARLVVGRDRDGLLHPVRHREAVARSAGGGGRAAGGGGGIVRGALRVDAWRAA